MAVDLVLLLEGFQLYSEDVMLIRVHTYRRIYLVRAILVSYYNRKLTLHFKSVPDSYSTISGLSNALGTEFPLQILNTSIM